MEEGNSNESGLSSVVLDSLPEARSPCHNTGSWLGGADVYQLSLSGVTSSGVASASSAASGVSSQSQHQARVKG
jgi:hypothetical protein